MNKENLANLCILAESGKYGIPAAAEEFDTTKIRYLRISDISDTGNLLDEDKKSVSSEDIENYLVADGDLLFARTGNSTGRAYFHEEKNGRLAYAGFLIKYKPDNAKINPKYLKYFTISNEYKKWVENLSSGSTRGNISAQIFFDCPVRFPDRDQQDSLVRVLSGLDAKIELNRRINAELERLAKTVYDYWFVQFDFPDAHGRPYKSSGGKMTYNPTLKRQIPEGWEVKELKYLAKVVQGQSPNGETYNEKGIGTLFYQGSTDFGERFPTPRQYTSAPTRFANKNDILLSVRAPVGTINIAYERCSIGRGLAALSSKYFCFIYGVLNNYKIVFDRRNTDGTTFGAINKDDISSLLIAAPYDLALLDAFQSIVAPSWNKQHLIGVESRQLAALRDWLLPMLMNGQVEVS